MSRVLSDNGRFSIPAKLSWANDVAEHTCLAFHTSAYALAKQNVLVFLPLLVTFFPSLPRTCEGLRYYASRGTGSSTAVNPETSLLEPRVDWRKDHEQANECINCKKKKIRKKNFRT